MRSQSAHGLAALCFLWEHRDYRALPPSVPRDQWLDEFFFCLLGGFGITYELNRAAFFVLRSKGYFSAKKYETELQLLQHTFESELRTPQFEPLTKDGRPRAYRFPSSKARVLAGAGAWLLQSCDFDLGAGLTGNATLDRDWLRCCPGVGYKTASWLLRNIGLGERLAIVDIHLLRTLKDLEIVPRYMSAERDYLEIEELYRDACLEIGARMDQMDLTIWAWARGGVQ